MVSSLLALDVGERPALLWDGGARTFAELNDRANRLLHGLRDAGVASGARIAVLTGNTPEFFEVAVATGHGGIAHVPMSPQWTADEVAYVLEDSGAAALVVDHRRRDVAERAARASGLDLDAVLVTGGEPGSCRSYEAMLEAASEREPTEEAPGSPMFYTSGTTGRPKGVISAGGSPSGRIAWPTIGPMVAAAFRMPVGGVQLLCGPVHHTAQWSWTVPLLYAGNTIVLHDGFDVDRVLEDIDRHGVTGTHLVPTQLIRLLRADPASRERFDGSSLAAVWHGAAPCPPEVKRQVIDWWGPIIWEYYGGTEGGVLSTVSSEEWLERPGTVGRIAAGYDVQVWDDEGERVAAGVPGTIWFRRSSGAQFEYHNAPEKTAASRRGAYATLGDVGYLDDDGYLFLSDRAIDLIISGGVNVYPAEVEHCLIEHDAVVDAAVIGVPDAEFGERVMAVVELVPGVAPGHDVERSLDAHARARIAGYKVPRVYEFVDAVPRLASGKVLKRQLRERYSAPCAG